MERIRVVIADDHCLTRHGLRTILNKEKDILVVGEAGDGRHAIQAVGFLEPDVILLDYEMPALNGVQVAAYLQQIQSPVKVIAFSAYDDREYVQAMLKAGACAFLSKRDSTEDLVNAIRAVAAGETNWISPNIAGHQLFPDENVFRPAFGFRPPEYSEPDR